jgi:Na+/glutamate symporter
MAASHLLIPGAIAGGLVFAALVLLSTQPSIRAAMVKSPLQAILWPLVFALCVLAGAAVARHCESVRDDDEDMLIR